MPQKKHRQEKIVAKLRQVDTLVPQAVFCRLHSFDTVRLDIPDKPMAWTRSSTRRV
ncbi:hypothetical protein [Jiella sp. M17.18]|uniref:hypothetical protein n=1 Tax=Jiella sp. M17.18 TaxID=3234247 RepID=UPI0034DF50D3